MNFALRVNFSVYLVICGMAFSFNYDWPIHGDPKYLKSFSQHNYTKTSWVVDLWDTFLKILPS